MGPINVKAAILSAILVAGFIFSLEWYWRARGFTPTPNDDKILWAKKRKEVYMSADEATIFIGGSRIKFDLDVPTWEKLTGEKAIQLAIVGTPPRYLLRNLADDENFKGKLIVDVTEDLFFYFPDSARRDKSAREAIEYYYGETPAQRASASINYFFESNLVLLEERKFSLTSLLRDLSIPNRPGIFAIPSLPKEFDATNVNRQTWMTPMFFEDTSRIQKVKDFFSMIIKRGPGIKGDTLTALLSQLKTAIDKITSRGGKVMFVRPPSSGAYWEMEKCVYPRQQYWDRLLEYTKSSGIHFTDYTETARLTCPEWSHLAPEDAATYTTQLVKILQEEKGWQFPAYSKIDTN